MMITKKGYARRARKMWRWIGEKSIEREKIVTKDEYFIEKGICPIPDCWCYCCEYTNKFADDHCNECPLVWHDSDHTGECDSIKSPFYQIVSENIADYASYAKLCFAISRLPLRR